MLLIAGKHLEIGLLERDDSSHRAPRALQGDLLPCLDTLNEAQEVDFCLSNVNDVVHGGTLRGATAGGGLPCLEIVHQT